LVYVGKKAADAAEGSVEAARQSAKAAALSLKANRPYLLVERVEFSSGPYRDNILVTANITFRNFGKGPALIDKLLVAMDRVESLPDPRDYSNCITNILTSQAVASGEPTSCTIEHALSREEMKTVRAGFGNTLIVYGLLTYWDVFKDPVPYETGFLWKFRPAFSLLKEPDRFAYWGDEYNFYT